MKKYTYKLLSSILCLVVSLFLVVCSTLAWFTINDTGSAEGLVMSVTDGNNLIKEITYWNLESDSNFSYYKLSSQNTSGTMKSYNNGTSTSEEVTSILMKIVLNDTSDVSSLKLVSNATQYLGEESGLYDKYLSGDNAELDKDGNCTHEFSLSSIVGFKLCYLGSDNILYSDSSCTTKISNDTNTSLDLFVDSSTNKLKSPAEVSVLTNATSVSTIYIFVDYSETLVEQIYSINLSNSSGLGAYYGNPIKYVSDFSLTIDGSKVA